MTGSFLSLAGVLCIVGLVVYGLSVGFMALSLLRPKRMTDGRAVWRLRRLSPGDMGIPFQDMSFSVRDAETGGRLKLAAWWMPHPDKSRHSVILLHGYGDAKVGAIAWAPMWRELGWNILALDLRAHGQSQGTTSTAGFWERHDVQAVIDQLREQKPGATESLALFGASVGAMVAAATAALAPGAAAIVLDSPPIDHSQAARRHMNLVGAPGPLLQWPAVALAQWLAHCDFDSIRLAASLQQVACPVMLIIPQGDLLVSEAEREQVRQVLATRPEPTRDVLWEAPTGHLMALPAAPAEYTRRLREFLAAIE